MDVHDALTGLRPMPRPRACTLGTFDGIHLGHQAVLAETVLRARALGGEAVAVTFHPHPAAVLGGKPVPMLCTTARRLALLAAAGVDAAVLIPFDRAFAARSAESFLGELFDRGIGALVLGYDSHFGKDRAGNADLAARLGALRGVAVCSLPAVPVGGRPVSSRRIRESLGRGDLADAAACLGRPWTLEGRVIRGDGRGRDLGFPTANLDTGYLLMPLAGVYAGRALVDGRPLKAAVNIGVRPTVGGSRTMVEVHLLDWDGDLYGQELAVDLLGRLRDERRFDGLEALRAAIRADVEAVRRTG